MNEQAILTLCEKLGTTVDQLIPKAISYGIYSTKLQITIFSIVLGLSVIFLILAVWLDNRSSYHASDFSIVFYILGALALPIGLCGVLFTAHDLHLWNVAPELQAYKMLLSWIGG